MEKRKVKFDKVFVITVIFIIIASLTACGKVHNKIDETTTEALTTTKATTKATTTETTTTKATTTTTTLKAITTTKPTTQKVTTTQKETTTKKAVPTEYDRVLSKLKKELNKKAFDEEANKLFYDTFEQLYQNYPTWKHGYRDLPSREKYITENLINTIAKIYNIEFYEKGSKEANELEEEGYGSAWTSYDENNNLCVSIIAITADKVKPGSRKSDVEKFFHEIRHCQQNEITDFFEGNEEVMQLYLEGGATFHMKFTNPFTLDISGIWSVENEKGDLTINYHKDICSGYLVDLNAYEKLVYLVGYDLMNEVEKCNMPLSTIKDAIAQKYGDKQAEKFLETMKNWYAEYLNGYKGEKIYNLSIELENQFLDFIKQDIEALKTKEEAEKYKPVYEFYINRNLPQIEDTNTQSSKDLTREIFDIETLDKMLEEKIK